MTNPLPFFHLAATTAGLRAPYPIRDAGAVLQAFPSHLIPEGFDAASSSLPLTYLDSAASTKMIGPARDALESILGHYANSHSTTYGAARFSTHAFERAHETVLGFTGADPATHVAVFVGHGATGAINRVARSLFWRGPEDGRDTVVFSGMEHHANQLPWSKYAPRSIGVPVDPIKGTLSLDRIRDALRENKGRVRLVAVTGVSNVTGIVNDVAALARLAHGAGAEILVDAAQTAAHRKIRMREDGVDYLVFSGHKVYAPGSPGVLVMPRSASPAQPDEMGGGIVLSVDLERHLLRDDLPSREEAGTPNIPGAVALAASLKTLEVIGMNRVWEHELSLTRQLVGGLQVFEEVRIFGDADLDRTPRAGVVAFSVDGMHHAVVSQSLADYFNIAVRNECFCAHPYVKALLGVTPPELEAFERAVLAGDHSRTPGMVRASLGIYSDEGDIERLHAAVDWIVANGARLNAEYEVTREGRAVRRDGWTWEPKTDSLF
ncbi:MAG TPA: aminotransferase class V-fold PLP-dependent enzyme [bacterium]|nr:aminotransferase class V-fold PLP-dependent enzyme [bacterium]